MASAKYNDVRISYSKDGRSTELPMGSWVCVEGDRITVGLDGTFMEVRMALVVHKPTLSGQTVTLTYMSVGQHRQLRLQFEDGTSAEDAHKRITEAVERLKCAHTGPGRVTAILPMQDNRLLMQSTKDGVASIHDKLGAHKVRDVGVLAGCSTLSDAAITQNCTKVEVTNIEKCKQVMSVDATKQCGFIRSAGPMSTDNGLTLIAAKNGARMMDPRSGKLSSVAIYGDDVWSTVSGAAQGSALVLGGHGVYHVTGVRQDWCAELRLPDVHDFQLAAASACTSWVVLFHNASPRIVLAQLTEPARMHELRLPDGSRPLHAALLGAWPGVCLTISDGHELYMWDVEPDTEPVPRDDNVVPGVLAMSRSRADNGCLVALLDTGRQNRVRNEFQLVV